MQTHPPAAHTPPCPRTGQEMGRPSQSSVRSVQREPWAGASAQPWLPVPSPLGLDGPTVCLELPQDAIRPPPAPTGPVHSCSSPPPQPGTQHAANSASFPTREGTELVNSYR